MKYALRVLALGHSKTLALNADQFAQLSKAKETLTLFGRFTENYRVVLEAYEHVEDSIHKVALGNLLQGYGGYPQVLARRVSLKSAMVGYLAAARYFLDSADKILKNLVSPADLEKFSKFRSSIYDSRKEYKFIEALRNYVQHRELPIEGMKHHNYVEDTRNRETSDLVTAVTLYVGKEKLQTDQKFKKEALVDMPDNIDILFCARAHMAGMWELHDFVIKRHEELSSKARSLVQSHIDSFSASIGSSVIGLHAVEANDDEVLVRQIPLLLDWDDARLVSLKQLGDLSQLHRWYISGKIQKA